MPESDCYEYIIDGYHRISTLFGILTSLKDQLNTNYLQYNGQKESNQKSKDWIINYDLEYDCLVKTANSILNSYCTLDKLIRTIDFLVQRDKIQNLYSNEDRYIEKMEDLSRILLNYEIPIIKLKNGVFDDMRVVCSYANRNFR